MQISMRKFRADYDRDSDILYLSSQKENAKNSVSIGDIIIDYSHNGEVVGIEFLDATETIPPLLLFASGTDTIFKDRNHLKEEFLNNIEKSHVSVSTRANFTIINFTLELNQETVKGNLCLPVVSNREVEKPNF